MDKFLLDKIRMTDYNLAISSGKCLEEIPELPFFESDYKQIGEFPDKSMFNKMLKRGERVDGHDRHYWF